MALTPDEVAARLFEMGSTIRRLHVRGCWPAGYRSSMPEPVHTREERFAALVQQFDIARREIAQIQAELEGTDGRLWPVRASQERVTNAAYGVDRPKADPPSPAEISRMDECMTWPILITHKMEKVQFCTRRTIWLKAVGMRTGKIAVNLHANRETVRLWWNNGCRAIADALNRGTWQKPPNLVKTRAA